MWNAGTRKFLGGRAHVGDNKLCLETELGSCQQGGQVVEKVGYVALTSGYCGLNVAVDTYYSADWKGEFQGGALEREFEYYSISCES